MTKAQNTWFNKEFKSVKEYQTTDIKSNIRTQNC